MILANISYLRNEISISLALLSAAAILLLLASPLALSNFLQPVQAQTPMKFRTTQPAITEDPNTGQELTLTFEAQGTTSSSNPQSGSITDGTFQISSRQDGTLLTSGHISRGEYSNGSNGASISMDSTVFIGQDTYHYTIITDCSTFEDNKIIVEIEGGPRPEYSGPVECSTQVGGGSTTIQQSSSMAESSQDGDGDGIPESSDRCPNNSHHRCFKEAA